MPYRIFTIILLFSLSFGPCASFATGPGTSIISLSGGIVTPDEFRGVTAYSYMDIPYGYSTAIFGSYRYFITSDFAVGLSAGIDDVKGDLTEGNPKSNGGVDGTVGTYIRHTSTIAVEGLVKYYEYKNSMLYGYIGAGYTFSKVEKAYNPEIYASYYQNGVNPYSSLPPYLSAQSPVYTSGNHFSGQVTALGVRTGDKVAWHIELGYGYKGIINTGISVKL